MCVSFVLAAWHAQRAASGFRILLFLFSEPFGRTPQGHTKLPDYVSVGQFPRTPLRDLFTAASADTLNLLSKCIIYEPRKRIGAREVCPHPPAAAWSLFLSDFDSLGS